MRIYPRRPIAERFFDKVEKGDGCWIWLGQLAAGGPMIWLDTQTTGSARRVSWELHFGEVPKRRTVVAGCGILRCVAPHHIALAIAPCMQGVPLAERFWAKVNKNGPLPPTQPELGNCWLWTGKIEKRFGYGQFGNTSSHRVAWELAFGTVPEGLQVLHKCDVPGCCRFDHLWLGDHDDNMADMVAKGRQARGERSGRAKLTESQIIQIRALRKEGAKLKDLGRQFGVHFSIIHDIEHRVIWKHVA